MYTLKSLNNVNQLGSTDIGELVSGGFYFIRSAHLDSAIFRTAQSFGYLNSYYGEIKVGLEVALVRLYALQPARYVFRPFG